MRQNKTFFGLAFLFFLEICLGVGLAAGGQSERRKVLIIGDSISIGYTNQVAQLLADKADVERPRREDGSVINCGPTSSGVANIDQWLGETQWDVIHFNWGLHDLCYRHKDSKASGHRDKINGKVSVKPEQYEVNLRRLVARLKLTGATLIWASTTPVPEGTIGRFAGDEITYNAIAAKVMSENGIVINDLHLYMLPNVEKYWQEPGNVHYTEEGSAYLAAKVAAMIEIALKPANNLSGYDVSVPEPGLFAEIHEYEVVEETLTANKTYENPYLDVDLWVRLTGPGGTYKIPAFWDGGKTFRVRLVATEPGTWTWSTGNRTGDSGLDNKQGSFKAVAWTEAEKKANPNRRGFIRVATNNHTLEYADGTPFFYAGDTWWSSLTKIYAWDSDDCLANISFRKAIAQRKAQGFNGINMIACFPSDTIKGIWDTSSHGQKVAEDGSTPFEISDSQDARYGVNFERINPTYWQHADRKMKHLWGQGFVPFIESVRRHEQWYSENPAERKAFVNYTRYLWARYGCYNMIYSWVHWDWDPKVLDAWKAMVNMAYSDLGTMPYGQPRTSMAWGSSLTTWCVEPDAVPLGAFDVHNVSNKNRDYVMYSWLRDIFNDGHPKPGFNVEPFYPGWGNKPSEGLNDSTMAQFQMYGSVLNGGFAGHAWGDTYYAGVATSTTRDRDEPISKGDPHKNGFNRWCAPSMGKLKDFILDRGHDYRILKPATMTHLVDTDGEWRVLALSSDMSQGLGFIAANRTKTDIRDLIANTTYKIEWWNIDYGGWSNTSTSTTDSTGKLIMPNKPNPKGWAFRILRASK